LKIRKAHIKTYTKAPGEQTKLTEREKKNTYSQTSRLENPEELELHHNHEKFLRRSKMAV
jgi:hypothetical protein